MYTNSAPEVVIPFVIRFEQRVPQMLLAHRIDHEYLTTPGGKIEPGETERQAASREVFQEAGIHISPREFRPTCEYSFPDCVDGTRFNAHPLVAYYKPDVHGVPKRLEPEKHGPWVWVDMNYVDLQLAHWGLFPYAVFFQGDWQDKVYRHGKRLHLSP